MIDIRPGDSIQSKVDANPAGTVFLIRGTHHAQSVVLKKQHNGDQFIGEDAVLDGDKVKEFAFAGLRGGESAQDIVIRNMAVTGYMPLTQAAAIRPYGYAWRWTLEDLDIHDNANWGVMLDRDWQVRRCHVHRMGTMGLGGGGGVVEDCEIDNNNTSGIDSHWEAGGMKFVYCTGMKVRRNHVHHNKGPGIWFDGNSTDALIQDNLCEDNYGPGIDWEINRGAVIEGNTCLRNGTDPTWADDWDLGGGGILVINGEDVIIRNNLCLDNQGGIGLTHADRGSFPNLDRVEVYGNLIGYTARQSGIAWSVPLPHPETVRFHDNRYQVDPVRVGFRIGGSSMPFPLWQAHWTGELLADSEPPTPPPPLVKPAIPTGLEAERSILWTPVEGANSYTVQIKTDDGWLPFVKTEQHEVSVGTRGRYRVRAVNDAGASAWATLLV